MNVILYVSMTSRISTLFVLMCIYICLLASIALQYNWSRSDSLGALHSGVGQKQGEDKLIEIANDK